jgi:hypothetical protein
MLKSSTKRSNAKSREQLASRDVATDLSQASAKHDSSISDTSSLLMGSVVRTGIFVVPSTLTRTTVVDLPNYSHIDLFAAQEEIRERYR